MIADRRTLEAEGAVRLGIRTEDRLSDLVGQRTVELARELLCEKLARREGGPRSLVLLLLLLSRKVVLRRGRLQQPRTIERAATELRIDGRIDSDLLT